MSLKGGVGKRTEALAGGYQPAACSRSIRNAIIACRSTYPRSTISEEQQCEFGQLVEDTAVNQIEAAQFLPHPGIRFPQNGCTSCLYLGLCLQNQPLIDGKLLRRPGGDLGWLDELEY